MTTSRRWVQSLSLAAGGLLICLPSILAAPGGGATVGTAGAVSTSGGHATSSVSVGAVHSAGPTGPARSSAGTTGGFRAGPVGNVGATGYRPSGLASGGNRTISNPTMSPGRPGVGVSPSNPYARSPSVARVNNAWSDPTNPRIVPSGAISRYGGYATFPHRSDPVYSTRPGNHLYAGAHGDGSNRFYNGHYPQAQIDRNSYRNHHRYYFNNFPYAVYYPYLYNNYGYAGYGNNGYGDGLADYSGLNTDANVADLGAPDFSNNPNNYYSYVAPEQETPNTDAPTSPTQPLPNAPAVGPQDPSAADKSSGAAQGPDSLVEAVQNELSHRGYFDGKPDSMYTPATREAIRRFQTDQHLPATGRINEATLHALHLD